MLATVWAIDNVFALNSSSPLSAVHSWYAALIRIVRSPSALGMMMMTQKSYQWLRTSKSLYKIVSAVFTRPEFNHKFRLRYQTTDLASIFQKCSMFALTRQQHCRAKCIKTQPCSPHSAFFLLDEVKLISLRAAEKKGEWLMGTLSGKFGSSPNC